MDRATAGAGAVASAWWGAPTGHHRSHLSEVATCMQAPFGGHGAIPIRLCLKMGVYHGISSGWWFQTCFIFHTIWDNPSH